MQEYWGQQLQLRATPGHCKDSQDKASRQSGFNPISKEKKANSRNLRLHFTLITMPRTSLCLNTRPSTRSSSKPTATSRVSLYTLLCALTEIFCCSPVTKFPGGPVDGPLNVAAKRLGITPTQALLAWAKAKGVVIVTSVSPYNTVNPSSGCSHNYFRTSSSKQHLQQYLSVGDIGKRI